MLDPPGFVQYLGFNNVRISPPPLCFIMFSQHPSLYHLVKDGITPENFGLGELTPFLLVSPSANAKWSIGNDIPAD